MANTAKINVEIEKMLGSIKGLRKTNDRHAMRAHSESMRQHTQVVYEYEPTNESDYLETGTKRARAKPLSKFKPLPPLALKGTTPLKSSDDSVSYIDSEFGRISIPINAVSKAIQAYDTSDEVKKGLNLKETEQMRINLQRLADFVSPSPRRRMKKSQYEQRTFSKDLYSRLNHNPRQETALSIHITEKYSPLFSEGLVTRFTGTESPFRNESKLKVHDMLKCWNQSSPTAGTSSFRSTSSKFPKIQ